MLKFKARLLCVFLVCGVASSGERKPAPLQSGDVLCRVSIWASDGTSAGTQIVNSVIFPGVRGSTGTEFVKAGRNLYFIGDDGVHGPAIWRTDGTSAGTGMTRDTYENTDQAFIFERLSGIGDKLYFTDFRFNIWVTDGTKSGTLLQSNFFLESQITLYNGYLYFSGYTDELGSQLFKADLNLTNIERVTHFSNGRGGYAEVLNNMLYFSGDDGLHGGELWLSDGTTAGTRMVKDLNPGAGDSRPRGFVALNDTTVLFLARSDVNECNLWKTDGTEAGTVVIKKIAKSSFSLQGPSLFMFNGRAYFPASDGVNGFELWSTDGTTEGTAMVKDLQPGPGSGAASVISVGSPAYCFDFATLGNVLLFSADDGLHGLELWRSDGTEAGTWLVKDINPGSLDSVYAPFVRSEFVNYNGLIYFLADDGQGRALWKTDGTEAGTQLVHRAGAGYVDGLSEVNGKLVFRTNETIYVSFDLPVPFAAPLRVTTATLNFDFNRPDRDSLLFSGEIPLAPPEVLQSTQVRVAMSGMDITIPLTAGKGASGPTMFTLRTAKSKLTGKGFAFSLKSKGGNFFEYFAQDGFLNTDVKSGSRVMPFSLHFGIGIVPEAQVLSQAVPLTYLAKKDKTGHVKLAK